MVRGSCPVLSPFLGCLSGSSELDWGSVELPRTYDVRFSYSECTLRPGLCLGWELWVFHAMSFSGSLSRSGGGLSFAFVTGFVAKTPAPPLLLGCGLHCTSSTNARQSQWETVISCAGGQVFPGPLGLHIVSDASGSFLPQVVACGKLQAI